MKNFSLISLSPAWRRALFPALFFSLFSLALPWALWPQEEEPLPSPDFIGIEQNLSELERLIEDTLNESEAQMRQLQDLKANLSEQETLLSEREASMIEQERLLGELREQLSEMSRIYKEQSDLSGKYERRSRFWRNFTLIGIPAAVVISGGITALIMALR